MTEHAMPASAKRRTTSSLRSGDGVPGSTSRHYASSIDPIDVAIDTRARCAA
ncbi:hypothetical protein [Saccharopolyspora mangrovi]|uniref:Uncharacterized protein n=1 Tax=Saccharopolyspora mangrovi TaxID=3082379 RepID=A0ABU6AIH0_9PSEU|nr:hypothetical protein [Saccharopolyspora sp. S2-29]MEB3371283.1 hypothetical protein [Saccharopolyspora sp. S2-29]